MSYALFYAAISLLRMSALEGASIERQIADMRVEASTLRIPQSRDAFQAAIRNILEKASPEALKTFLRSHVPASTYLKDGEVTTLEKTIQVCDLPPGQAIDYFMASL